MSLRIGLIAALCVGAAALVSAAPADAQPRGARACTAEALTTWRAGDRILMVEGFMRGPTCKTGVSVIVIRDRTGAVVFSESVPNESNFVLREPANATQMHVALSEWLRQSDGDIRTADQLPAWNAELNMPASGEFPFYPEEQYATRDAWNALRASKAPIFCYVRGIESTTCLGFDRESGLIFKIGAQSFPG